MKKVAKFGGSSLANSEQIKKACKIVLADKDIKAVCVSAPGKRYDEDIKITDLLIDLYEKYRNKDERYKNTINKILKRFEDIADELGIDKKIIFDFKEIIDSHLKK